jgi:dihydrofolate reductase
LRLASKTLRCQTLGMRKLRYSINVTLDGCGSHEIGVPDEASHRYAAAAVASSDLLFGRKTYELMEFWRPLAKPGAAVPEGMQPWMMGFAKDIDPAKKYLVSRTVKEVGWNTTLLSGDLETEVRALKAQPGKPLLTGGIDLALQLAELGLIDEYDFVVQPRIAGRGPTVFAGLSKVVELKLLDRKEFPSGSTVLRFAPR